METNIENRGLKKGQVKVRAKAQMHEDGRRAAGEEFVTTEERRKALGDHVEDVAAPAAVETKTEEKPNKTS